MHVSSRRGWVAAVASAAAGLSLLVAGCANDAGTAGDPPSLQTSMSAESTDAALGEASVPYALLEDEGWTLDEAVDWPPDNVMADIEPVPSDWWAEYERLEPQAGGVTLQKTVKLTGLPVGLDAYRAAMERVGFSLRPVETSSGAGLTGTTGEEGAAPVIVAVPIEGGTLELLSYELTSEELVALAAEVRTVDDPTWRAAGGVVR